MNIPPVLKSRNFWAIIGVITVLLSISYQMQNQKEKSNSDYTCEEIKNNMLNTQGTDSKIDGKGYYSWQAIYTSNGCYVYK